MNKRGQVPTLLLFIIALILVVTALFSFVSFKGSFASDSEGRSGMLSDVAFYENYVIKESESVGALVIKENGGKEEFIKRMGERNLGIVGLAGFFDMVKNGDFKFEKSAEGHVFEIKELKVQASAGENFIRRDFGFAIEFDSTGEVIGVEKLREEDIG